MLKDVHWAEDGTYTPQGEHTPMEFFNYALSNSDSFDIELGYFNSAAINVLSRSFASFIKNNGHMRMAINNIVSKNDKDAIEAGEQGGIDAPFDLSDWSSIYDSLDEYGEHFFKCLAYLIQENRITIKIIKPRHTDGIAHTKRGLFSDGETIVSFTGSANFTLGGLFNNREEITVSFSTSLDPHVQKRIENLQSSFDKLIEGNDDTVEYLEPSELEEAIRTQYGKPEIEELLDVEKKLKKFKYKNLDEDGNHLNDKSSDYDYKEPCFPYPTGPRDYQKQAFENWKNNGQRGLFAMATGTGKTITSLNCLLEQFKDNNSYKAIIIVPTITLVNQWADECKKFNFNNIIKVCSGTDWKSELANLSTQKLLKRPREVSYIIITTYASFGKLNTFKELNGLFKSTLLIADECHNFGSSTLLRRMPKVVYNRRIGLSATPERQFDNIGNASISEFFGSEKGYTFEYSMKEAIDNGVLCEYFYYPHLVELNDDELQRYQELSEKINRYYNPDHEGFDKGDPILTALLLKRKRIIHKAVNKFPIFKDILRERYEKYGGLKYTLVYVPEGNDYADLYDTESYADDDKTEEPSETTTHLIDEYTKAVRNINKKITVKEFVSGMADRETVLSQFANGDIGVLTSMKCLDEGVDVPRAELAIFCASTGNSRQFIQRRGRILRKHKDKKYAYIHDLVVAPKVNPYSDSYNMESGLLKKELERVKNFSRLSLNESYTVNALLDIMNYYNLNLYDNEK